MRDALPLYQVICRQVDDDHCETKVVVAEVRSLGELLTELYWSSENGEGERHSQALLEIYHRWRVTGALPDPYQG